MAMHSLLWRCGVVVAAMAVVLCACSPQGREGAGEGQSAPMKTKPPVTGSASQPVAVPGRAVAEAEDVAAGAGEATGADAGDRDWRIAGEYVNRRGFRNVYAIIPPGLSQEELVARAEAIHQQEPDAWLWLLDSDAELGKVLAALPAIEQTPPDELPDMSQFPSAYLDKHVRANSALVLHPDGRRTWVLYAGQGRSEELATLPCIDGKGQCRDKGRSAPRLFSGAG